MQNLWGFGPAFFRALQELGLDTAAAGLLRRLGYHGGQQPDILQHLFMTDAGQLTTIIDDQPLSETSPIRAYTADGRNYISWLIDAANASLDAVVGEQGFTDDVSPQALLYLLPAPRPDARVLRHRLRAEPGGGQPQPGRPARAEARAAVRARRRDGTGQREPVRAAVHHPARDHGQPHHACQRLHHSRSLRAAAGRRAWPASSAHGGARAGPDRATGTRLRRARRPVRLPVRRVAARAGQLPA